MLNSEYKLLKYISKHPDVSFKKLKNKFRKFENLTTTLRRLDTYIEWSKMEESANENNIPTGNYHFVDDSTFNISRNGEELIEKKNHEFWSFFFPYAITTLIAVASVVVQIIELLLNVSAGN